MQDTQKGPRAGDVFDLQEKYLKEQIGRQNEFLGELRRKRRLQVLRRSLSLLAGLVLTTYGAIEVFLLRSLASELDTILVVGFAELTGFPLFVHGCALFHRMAFDANLTHASEKLIDLQEDLVRLRLEHENQQGQSRTTLDRDPAGTLIAEVVENPHQSLAQNSASICPDCGKEVNEHAKICRNCGHLFI